MKVTREEHLRRRALSIATLRIFTTGRLYRKVCVL
jgi:hypothetical protein